MAELKTKKTEESVEVFLNGIEDEQKRSDCLEIATMMAGITNAPAKMWGGSIIGFGDYHYKYESGRENDWFQVGFSPRKANITLYLMGGTDQFPELMKDLGKYKNSASCLYIKKLTDVKLPVLKKLIEECISSLK